LAASNKVTALISSSTSDARLAVIIPPALLANQAIICIQIMCATLAILAAKHAVLQIHAHLA
jgi:hypothetical protein